MLGRRRISLATWLTLLALVGIAGPRVAPALAASAAIIDNGTVQLGVNPAADLIVPGGTLSGPSGSSTFVGLRYIPTNADALSPGCLCEGWGVANADLATTTFSGFAGEAFQTGPTQGLVVVDGFVTSTTGKTQAESAGSAYRSIVTTGGGRVRVTHDYRPSASPNLYEIAVAIENIGATAIGDLRYRRVMDWDVEPFVFNEYVEIHVGSAPNLLRATTDGFQSANPLEILSPAVGALPTTLVPGSPDYFGGPTDQGALFDFAFGALAPGQTKTFVMYYGAAASRAEALTAVTQVGASAYSLGIPKSSTDSSASPTGPNIFIFAYGPNPSPSAPTLAGSAFFGGSGDQRGTGISVRDGAIYASGIVQPQTQTGSDTALVLKYATPLGASPAWSRTVGSGTNFFGVSATTDGVYAGGWNVSLTTDGVGGKEAKSFVAKFAPDGTAGSAVGGALWATGGPGTLGAFFAYTGVESFYGATTAQEAGSTFVYAVGGGQPASYCAYLLAKYGSAGSFVAAATDSTVGITFSSGIPSAGCSNASGVTVLNGNVFLAGMSGWSHEGDASGRPALWKYDASLTLLGRFKDASLAGSFNAITALDNALYAVGFTHTPGVSSSEDFLIQKYSEAGTLVWSKTSGGANTDVLTGVVAVGSRLFAVGYTQSQGAGGEDAVILEIDPDTGTTLSTTLFGGAQHDRANGVATDGTDLYVIGESRSFSSTAGNVVGSNDVMLLRYALGAPTSAPTATALASAANPSDFGQTVTFTATVTSGGGGTPTGTVTFKDGAATLGTGPLDATGHATFATSALAVGPHSITAEYGGDASFAGSTSAALLQTVKAATTTTVASSANPSAFGQGVTFTATVLVAAPGSGTPTGTVTFKDGGITLGTGALVSGQATYNTSTLVVGAHTITAQYDGDSTFTGSMSAALGQTVNRRAAATTVSLDPSAVVVGQSSTVTVTVVDTEVLGTAQTPTGTVTLTSSVAGDVFSDPCTLGPAIWLIPTVAGSCFITVTPATASPHTITASFAATSIHSASAGGNVLDVSKTNTSISLVSAPNPSALGEAVTFTAFLSIAGPVTPSGWVQFFDGATLLATIPIAPPYTITYTTSDLSADTHSITAAYTGDAAYNGSTSNVVSQTVKAAVSGTVRDLSSGNPLPGAFVDFFNASAPSLMSFVRFVTGSVGTYRASISAQDLPPGNYFVRVTRTGDIVRFYTAPGSNLRALDFTTASAITVTSDANVPNIDVSLTPGGTVSGYIREADGVTAIPGASIFLNRVAGILFSAQFSGGPVVPGGPFGVSSPDGSFSVQGLIDGDYQLRVQAPGHIVAWWSGDPAHPAGDGGVAKPITITNASTENVSVSMTVGGTTISGQVTRSGGGGVPVGTIVQILNGAGSLFPEAGFVTQTNTTASGAFSVSGLGPGAYIVQAFGFQAANGTGEGWYPAGATSAASAVPVPVGTSPVTGINFSVPGFTDGAFPGSISGTVRDADSQPISFAIVQAVEPFVQFPIRTVSVNGNGTYTIPGLGPGSYIVRAITERTYEQRYSGGLPGQPESQVYPQAARRFTIGPTTTTTAIGGVNVALPATAATIRGTVTSGGQPVEGVLVQARNFFDNNTVGARTFRDGTYLIRGVPAGSSCSDVLTCQLKLRAFAAAGFATRYWPAANGFDDGAFIEVGASQNLTGYDLDLLPSNGGVSGTATAQGPSPLPVVGAAVQARDAATGETANFAFTDALGHWSDPDLLSGSYRFRLAGPGVVTTWSGDKPTREAADIITIGTGQVPTPLVFSVATNPATLKGLVKKSGGSPLAGAGVIVCDGATGGFVTAGGVTDSNGAYFVEGLAGGTYVLQARALGYARRNLAGPDGPSTTPACVPYPSQTVVTYGNALGVRATGTVNVAAGATVLVPDVTLTRSSDITGTVHYTGSVSGTLHVGLFLDAGLTQQAYDFTPSPQAFPKSYGFTNAVPDTKGVLPGTYYVAAWIDSNGNGARDSGETFGAIAAAVTVGENATIGAQDITLTDVADLLITKTGPSSAVYLDNISYTITVTNTGLPTASTVTVTDELPAALTFVSATASQGSCTDVAGTVTCNLGGLGSGASATVTLSVHAAAAGTVTNSASVTSSLSDPNTGNNSSSATVTVQQASQTITVTTHAPATATYNTSFTVAATASSGLGVSIAASGACSGSGTGSALVTMTSGTGACTVTYDQAGNANYSAATQVTESTTALLASQTITVTQHAPATAAYNTSFTVAAAGGGSGNPVTIAGSGACSGSGNDSATITMTSGTGTCTVSYDQAGNANYSAAAQVTESATAQTAATTTSVTASVASSTFGDAVTFTATVAVVSPVTGTPTGTVQFQDNGVNLGDPIALPASGTVSLTTSSLHVGPHTLSAVYSGDGNFSGSTGSVAETVNQLNTSTVVTTSGSPSYTGQSVTFTATVTPANAAVTATGTVQFTDSPGANLGGPVPVVNGTASITTASLTAGTHTITASYSGDDFNPSSGSVSHQVNSTATFEGAATADSTVSPPPTPAGYTPTEPPVVTASVTFDPLPTSYSVVLNAFNFIPTVIDEQGNRIVSDRVPESPIVILTDDTTATPSSLAPVTTTAVTFTADVNLADWFTTLPTGQIHVELNYVNFLTDPSTAPSDTTQPSINIWAGTVPAGDVTIPVGPTCGSGGNAGGTGCPFATKATVRLHTIDLGAWKASTTGPLGSVHVRVFDRNSAAFQTVAGSKNPDGSRYGPIFEADAGRVGACVTDVNGMCFAGSQTSGDFLVIVKYFDPATNKKVYVGRPESPSDFVNGVASKDFQIIKVLRNGIFQEYRGGSKTTFSGSTLEVIAPDSGVWIGTQSLYPFIFTSDSTWTVDVCARVPAGYVIVGAYDETGAFVTASECVQALVANQTRAIVFEVHDIGSPEPTLDATLTVVNPKGKSTVHKVKVEDIRRPTLDAEVAKIRANRRQAAPHGHGHQH